MRRITNLDIIVETCRRLSDERIQIPSVPFDALGGQSVGHRFARSGMDLPKVPSSCGGEIIR